MTKQTVELVYHDPETERPEKSLNSMLSIEVLGHTGELWIPVYYTFSRGYWVSLASGNSIKLTVWIDMPPKPKKKVWVKKEAHEVFTVQRETCSFAIPPKARNVVCTYEIREEQS